MSFDPAFWAGKRIFLTGHTGFKGGWMTLWLAKLGAHVTGVALDPPTTPSFYEVCALNKLLEADLRIDIRDSQALSAAMKTAAPEIVFHLAAQPLVRRSYHDPIETYQTNVMGTVNLFEAVRATPTVKAVVNVTTDKCYENREWVWPYRENEPMGGHDPYSNSKACSELITASYRNSFFSRNGVALASGRAGNVIGGGDWAADRLLPDVFRAVETGETLVLRFPQATRPWQHVLEPIYGYLTLAEKLYREGIEFAEGWNFGPEEADSRSVQWIVERLISSGLPLRWRHDDGPKVHEAGQLMLSSAKAKSKLSWHPRWHLAKALDQTFSWYQAWRAGSDMSEASREQIKHFLTGNADDKAN
ncbi:MAG TPA: CDP-glucose 4,6-dehydratase [Afipia sp.]